MGISTEEIVPDRRRMATAILILLTCTFLLSVLSILVFLRQHEVTPILVKGTYGSPPDPAPLVSIIVPARNEEECIGDCLGSALAQDYPNFEVILVNDQSTDRTGEIAAELEAGDSKLRCIPGRELPPGWMGKNNALFVGVREARGEYLLFLDADSRLEPECLTQTVRCAIDKGSDLLTICPDLICGTFWEKVVHPLLIQMIFIWAPREKINDPSSKVAAANGPYMLFRRSAYEQIGGHEAVKDNIVEDLELGRNIKRAGLRLSYVDAPTLMSLRMYTCFSEIWEGWSKNFYISLGGKVGFTVLASLGIFIYYIVPWFALPASLAVLVFGGWSPVWFAVLALALGQALVALALRKLLHRLELLDPAYPYLQPLGAAVLIGILVNSTIRTQYRKGVSWKGRTYLKDPE